MGELPFAIDVDVFVLGGGGRRFSIEDAGDAEVASDVDHGAEAVEEPIDGDEQEGVFNGEADGTEH